MFESAKKGFYIGLGLASFTKDKAESFAKEFSEQTKLSEEEGRRFADYLNQESQKAQKELSETVEGMVKKTLNKLPLRSRLGTLEDRVTRLEQALLACCPEKAEEFGIGVPLETAEAEAAKERAEEDGDTQDSQKTCENKADDDSSTESSAEKNSSKTS